MPTIWYVREGVRPNTVNDPGVHLTFLDFERAFFDRPPRYISKAAPEFNTGAPSSTIRVIVEVQEVEGTNLMFPFTGFYLMADMTPDEVKEELGEIFSTVMRAARQRSGARH